MSDTTKLRSLGWEPRATIRDSIRAYWDYLHQQQDIEDILDHAEQTMRSLNVVRAIEPDANRSSVS